MTFKTKSSKKYLKKKLANIIKAQLIPTNSKDNILVMKFDLNEIAIEEASYFAKQIQKIFNNQNICFVSSGVAFQYMNKEEIDALISNLESVKETLIMD